ncbi:MAG: site-specific integrase [Phycisphaera sp.]|nr:MAG: site-specific integrase [Phycisphaera sp.]
MRSFREHLATWLERQGVDPTVIQSIMRHAKVDVTRRSYMDDRLMDLAVRGSDALRFQEDERESQNEPDDLAAGKIESKPLRLVRI